MKIFNIQDVNKFCDVLDKCEGNISLVTENGDELNLKSKLSQYVSLTQYFGSSTIPELEIRADEPKDILRLTKYLMTA